MRVFAGLLVLLALQFAPGHAYADEIYPGGPDSACKVNSFNSRPSACTRADAYAACMVHNTWVGNQSGITAKGCHVSELDSGGAGGNYESRYNSTASRYFAWGAPCPNGGTWDDVSKICFDSQQCLAMEPLGTSYVNSVTSSTCSGGCEFKAVENFISVEIPGKGAQTTVSGWEPTGLACPAGTPEPQAMGEPQQCVPAGNDAAGRAYTVCIKSDGRHCFTGGPGRQICWRPGETGEKVDGPTLQKREVGGTPTPPSTTPPPGTTLDATGIPMTATTTVGGNTFNTTTNNYTTGGPEVSPNQPPSGEPGDGTGSPGGDGDGDEPGSVTGGVNCDDPPVVQGDPILANIVLQTWGTRCAAEGADKVATTGDLYDCSAPWMVTGPEGSAHVVRLQAMRDEICLRDGDGDGQPDWTQGDAPPLQNDGEPGPGEEPAPPSGLTIGSDLLDMDGFLGTATCPTLGVLEFGPFGSFDLDSEPVWCDLVAIMRAIVLMMAAFTAINILLGRD